VQTIGSTEARENNGSIEIWSDNFIELRGENSKHKKADIKCRAGDGDKPSGGRYAMLNQ